MPVGIDPAKNVLADVLSTAIIHLAESHPQSESEVSASSAWSKTWKMASEFSSAKSEGKESGASNPFSADSWQLPTRHPYGTEEHRSRPARPITGPERPAALQRAWVWDFLRRR